MNKYKLGVLLLSILGILTVAAPVFVEAKVDDKVQNKIEFKGKTIKPVGVGQPIVAGKITAISSSTISLQNGSSSVYTIDASAANVYKKNSTSTLSTLKVGDVVVVQGVVNGTSIKASSIIDKPGEAIKTKIGEEKPGNGNGRKVTFFMGMGNFFRHLFGF